MKRLKRALMLILVWPVAVIGFSSVIIPTTLVYNPTDVQIEGTNVRVYRSYPLSDWAGFPRPWVRYHETVTSRDGRACPDEAFFQYTNGGAFGEWDIASWAAPCTSPEGYVWSATWRGYLFGFEWRGEKYGILPMRPVTMMHVVFAQESS